MSERYYLKPMLCRQIEEYCKANNIEDINAFANRCATQGFTIVKFGLSPKDNIERETKGIKDIKNENKRKRKEKDVIPAVQRKEEDTIGNNSSRTKEEEIKPVEERKEVTVRKIRIIKKKQDD